MADPYECPGCGKWECACPPFRRKIVQQNPEPDGSVLVKYSCGHEAVWVIPPQGITYTDCAECVNEYVEQSRKEPHA